MSNVLPPPETMRLSVSRLVDQQVAFMSMPVAALNLAISAAEPIVWQKMKPLIRLFVAGGA